MIARISPVIPSLAEAQQIGARAVAEAARQLTH